MEVKQLAGALLKARQQMGKVHKTGKNQHHNYDYANLEDILNVVEAPIADNGLVVVQGVEELIVEDATNRVLVKLRTTLMHTSGESVDCFCWGEGVDKQDKATYKAITGARKYALACLFNLVTTDDPEMDNTDRAKTAQPPAKKQSIFGKYSDAIAAAATAQDLTDLYADFNHNKYLKDDEKKRLISLCGERKAIIQGKAA